MVQLAQSEITAHYMRTRPHFAPTRSLRHPGPGDNTSLCQPIHPPKPPHPHLGRRPRLPPVSIDHHASTDAAAKERIQSAPGLHTSDVQDGGLRADSPWVRVPFGVGSLRGADRSDVGTVERTLARFIGTRGRSRARKCERRDGLTAGYGYVCSVSASIER